MTGNAQFFPEAYAAAKADYVKALGLDDIDAMGASHRMQSVCEAYRLQVIGYREMIAAFAKISQALTVDWYGDPNSATDHIPSVRL